MNKTISTKYELAPETIKKRSLNPNDGKYFQEIYGFMRLKKMETIKQEMIDIMKKLIKEKKLRSLLNLDENVLVLTERLRKKDVPANLYQASTDNIPFFIRNIIFTIYKRVKLDNGIYLYWVEEDSEKIDGRFFREELFTLNNQFLR